MNRRDNAGIAWDIFSHRKWVRAIRRGGGDVVHLWLAMVNYCRKNMTDGYVPEDMLSELHGPKRFKPALAVLLDEGILELDVDGHRIHDYLDHWPSKEEVLHQRWKWREKKRGIPPDTPPEFPPGNPPELPRTYMNMNKKEEEKDPEASLPAKDLTGLPRVSDQLAGSDLSERVQSRGIRPLNEPPLPRHDPLGERITLARWWPDADWLAWFSERGLTDSQWSQTLIEAKDKLLGRHEIDWWDTKLIAFVEAKLRPRKAPGELEHEARKAEAAKTNEKLMANARAGVFGKKIQERVESGSMTAAVLRALLEERQEDRAGGMAT